MPVDVPVSGVVTLNGQPLAGATVTFDTDEPQVRAMLVGVTDAAGKFETKTATTQTTAYEGKYRVTISRMVKPDGSPLGPDEMPADFLAVESLPARYSNPLETTLDATVPAGGQQFEFKLTAP
jgi:hypothetical protein